MSEEVSLREITRDTLSAVLRLKVAPEQEQFVASNAQSLAQAHFEPVTPWYRAIYVGDEPAGFAMVEYDLRDEVWFLWRFMVDARFQGRGVGRRAIQMIFDHVRSQPHGTLLLTSCVPAPGGPGPFYEKMGFTYTGEEEEGELVMRRAL